MKARVAAAAVLVATGAYAQGPVSYTTIYFDDCPTASMDTIITITQGVTATHCPQCDTTTPPMHTTVYTTTYQSLCPTGTVPVTHTITESCADEPTPTCGQGGETRVPPGFTITEKTCTVGCGDKPMLITITEPCDCEATEGTRMGPGPTDAHPTSGNDGASPPPAGGNPPPADNNNPAPTGGEDGDRSPAPTSTGNPVSQIDDGKSQYRFRPSMYTSNVLLGQMQASTAPAPAGPARPECTDVSCPALTGGSDYDSSNPPADGDASNDMNPPAAGGASEGMNPPAAGGSDSNPPAAGGSSPSGGDSGAQTPPYPTTGSGAGAKCPGPYCPLPSTGMGGNGSMDNPEMYTGTGSSLSSVGLIASTVMAALVGGLAFAF